MQRWWLNLFWALRSQVKEQTKFQIYFKKQEILDKEMNLKTFSQISELNLLTNQKLK